MLQATLFSQIMNQYQCHKNAVAMVSGCTCVNIGCVLIYLSIRRVMGHPLGLAPR